MLLEFFQVVLEARDGAPGQLTEAHQGFYLDEVSARMNFAPLEPILSEAVLYRCTVTADSSYRVEVARKSG